MTCRQLRWFGTSCVAAVAALSCSEERVALLEPLPTASVVSDSGSRGQSAPGILTAACNRWSAEREPDPPLVMSVIDVSGTMLDGIPGSTGTKWDIERSVLTDAVGWLPAKVGLGILYFPNMATSASASSRPASACVNLNAMIPISLLGAPSSAQRSTLTRSLVQTEPNILGGAPTLDAYLAALEELGRTSFDGTRQMLLITDGQPTLSEGCVGNGTVESPVDPTPVVSAISAARRAGIRTFVIGSPGSQRTNSRGDDARPWLSHAAQVGGTAPQSCSDNGPNYCHYDMTQEPDFARGLSAALADIQRRIVECDVPLPDPPQNRNLDLDHVNVVFTSTDGTSTLIVMDDTPSCSNGWYYSGDHQRIVLCDQACSAVNAELGSKLELVFGCPTVLR